ncbi:MAG: glycoside hydrolase family 78 protein [Clostridia bacterium]|nr:glycoside hydrolase family 78 protein [Clostridia bacterium]
MLEIRQISIDNQDLYLPVITDDPAPVFRWKLASDKENDLQRAYRITVRGDSAEYWDSGIVKSRDQYASYKGKPLPDLEQLSAELFVYSGSGDYAWDECSFSCYLSKLDAPWIASTNKEPRRVVRFVKDVEIDEAKEVASAFVIYCGLGYCSLFVNKQRLNPDIELDPAFSDYSKTAYFVIDDIYTNACDSKTLRLAFEVADGWRRFDSPFLKEMGVKEPTFAGDNLLSAKIIVKYTDGTVSETVTGPDWQWTYSNTVSSSIYDGTVFDAGITRFRKQPVRLAKAPCEDLRLMTIPPVMRREKYAPVDIFRRENGDYIVDFGQNIAGVIQLGIPDEQEPGTKIRISYAEELSEDGSLYTAPLRSAKATDTYVCGEPSDLPIFWTPSYTYHGFRYISVSGYAKPLSESDVLAIALYTAIGQTGDFSCGSPMLNAIHRACVATEKSNIHSILTDCPQRDERMGWMNDATVRFGAFPYNFDISRIFPKIVQDLRDVQSKDGAITCTAPFLIGGRPADPVCSSYLVAGYEYYMLTGDKAFLSKYFDGFAAWEECLLSRSDNYIVNYSYYGDWAGPEAACVSGEDPHSKVTPGEFMSTGFSYYNCKLLSFFASELGKKKANADYTAKANAIRKAFLAKWFDERTLAVAGNSQGALAFALWLDILPENSAPAVAEKLHNILKKASYKITTGNITTRYLLEVLTRFGYVDDAYRIMTCESYPGFGFMLQNEATTIWERFELKKEPSMNSHNHPMYAACDIWFYKYLLGITNLTPGWKKCAVKPYLPEGLLSARGSLDTPYGKLCVRWAKRYGKKLLMLTVPFGMECEVSFEGAVRTVKGSAVIEV